MNLESNLLIINNLSVSFPNNQDNVKAIDSINFHINIGEVLGIVGESGSGKTVTGLSILGLIEREGALIDSGQINFNKDGESLNLLDLKERDWQAIRGKKISMIFQDPNMALNPTIRCGSQLEESIFIHQNISKEDVKTKALALLKKVGLEDPERIYKSYPHQISGGQLQRVMIAMGISNEPRLLIADEATTSLDVTVQKQIIDLLKELNTSLEMAIIFISHDLPLVASIADRIVVMKDGLVKEISNKDVLFKNAKDPYTRALINCRPRMDQAMKSLPQIDDFKNAENEATILRSLALSSEEKLERKIWLDNQPELLVATDLSCWYVSEKSFFGKAKSYVKAVDDISFSIKEGAVLGLVGASGSGKTTLAQTLVGLKKPQAGILQYKGKRVFSFNKEEIRDYRKDVQLIFQNPYSSLNPRIKVGDAIAFGMEAHNLYHDRKERKEKILSLLHDVGLKSAHYDLYPNEFSGGQRQRISIAKALAVQPKFLICDECVSSLDVSVQAQILNLLLKLKDKFQLTYLFISHDLAVVKFISDDILVMEQGKIVERGTSDEIYNNPVHSYTKQLIASIPTIYE